MREGFYVTVPLGMQLQQGTRVMIDQTTPTQRPYVICVPSGCISDYEADPTWWAS